MTHNLLGVGDDRWLRESLRRDPLQELRECKEELARKNELLNRFAPPPPHHTAYRESSGCPYPTAGERPMSAQAFYGNRAYQTTTTTTRPVLEQRVYNERVTAPVHPEPVQPVHASLVTSKVTTENTQMRTENHELRMKVADLQMRVDRLLKGRDQVEAEGSGRFSYSI